MKYSKSLEQLKSMFENDSEMGTFNQNSFNLLGYLSFISD